MTLTDYDPQLLEFMFQLTKLPRLMSFRELARTICFEDGTHISSKTVERWFRYLERPFDHPLSEDKTRFNYFQTFRYERLGLQYVLLFLTDPALARLKHTALFDHSIYAAQLYDTMQRAHVLHIGLLIPPEALPRLQRFLALLQHKHYFRSFSCSPVRTGFTFYSPWHNVVDKQGIFHPELNHSSFFSEQFSRFQMYRASSQEKDLLSEVKKYPFIIPVFFEHYFRLRSSRLIWPLIKTSLGSRLSSYLRTSTFVSDRTGEFRIAETLRHIITSRIAHQVRVEYIPLEMRHTFSIYGTLSFSSEKQLSSLLEVLCCNSLFMKVYTMDKKEVFFIASVNATSFARILDKIGNSLRSLFFFQYEQSLPLLMSRAYTRFNYKRLFDEKKVKWNVLF